MTKFLFILELLLTLACMGGFSSVAAAGREAGEKRSAPSEESVQNVKKEEKTAAPETKKDVDKQAAEEAKRTVIARVNGADINMFALTRAMNRVAPKYIKKGDAATNEITDRIKGEALDGLIFDELAVQAAKKEGLNPGPEAIDRVMSEVKKNLGTEQAYKKYLEKNDLTEDALKKLIERSQCLEMITAREVYKKVKVEERLLKEDYEKKKAQYLLPENYAVKDVWFLKGNDDAARKNFNQVLKNIKVAGNDPDKLVLDGTFIIRTIIVSKERYPEIYKGMKDMGIGDLSGVIDEKDGFHIIKVVKKQAPRQATFEEARPMIESKLLYPAQEQRRREWEKGLRKKAKIDIFVEQNDVSEGKS